jgi:rhodanese-related sulfurtransferase
MSLTTMTQKKAVDTEVQKELQYQQWKKNTVESRKNQLERKHIFQVISIEGKAKNGKSGLALDIRTPAEVKEGQIIRFLDFDDGAEVTWKTCWNNDPNIYVYCPNHYNSDGTENYALTMQNALNFIRESEEIVLDGLMKDKPTVRAFVIDGMDKWNDCATNKLRYERVKGNRSKMMEPIPPTAYGARNIDHNEVMISALKLECDKVFITHLKPTFTDHMNPNPTGFVANWNKDVPDKMLQMIIIRDESVGNTTKYVAKLKASKTNPNKVGKVWTIFESNSKTAKWTGIPELQKRGI